MDSNPFALDPNELDSFGVYSSEPSTSSAVQGQQGASHEPMDSSGGADADKDDDGPAGKTSKKQKSCAPCRIRRVK